MSKNFELLHQIGFEEELFRSSGLSKDMDESERDGATLELDHETRERILQNSSLPDVFQTSQSSAFATEASPAAFRTSRNPAGPIGHGVSEHRLDLSKEVQVRVDHEVPLPEKRQAKKRVLSSRSPVSPAPSPVSGSRQQRDKLEGVSRPSRWMDLIKEGARSWGRNAQTRNNHDGTNRRAIALEEEIKLVQRVFPETDRSSPRVALFAGLEKDDGCASICARTARMLATRSDGEVCVVDANFQSPSLHHHFGLDNRNGLAEAVLGYRLVKECAEKRPERNLWVMPSGRAVAQMNFPEVSERMKLTLAELRDAFRYVVVHSSPFRQGTVSNFLSCWTDGVVLVVEANSTLRDTARRVKENLAAANVSVLGVVLNNRTFPIPEALYRRL